VLLIVLDTLTVNAAGLGTVPARMPALERMAEKGLQFRHAISNAPWTVPAHGSLFTGLLPSEHLMDAGNQFVVWEDEQRGERVLPVRGAHTPKTERELSERWLPALFAQAGYETVCASNNPWVGRLTQMDHGFHLIRDTLSVRLATRRRLLRSVPKVRSLSRATYHAYRAFTGQGDLLAMDALDRIREWHSRRDRSKPFFLFVNLIEAHAPYLTPMAGKAVRSAGGGVLDAFRAMRLIEPRQAIRYNIGVRKASRSQPPLDVLRAMHEHAAGYLDTILEQVLAGSHEDRRGLLTCVTSDHGESFGDREALLHGFTMDEAVLHIPLVLAGPDIQSGEVTDTVELRQVYSTLVEGSGIHAPTAGPPSLLRAGARDVVAQRDRALLPRWAGRSVASSDRAARLGAVYRDPWKIVVGGRAAPRLYDLSGPGESVDQAAARPDVVDSLLASLPAWPERSQEPSEPTMGVDDSVDGQKRLTRREEQLIAEHLSALGYLE
jgi:arylsulfatase A-like enzyme